MARCAVRHHGTPPGIHDLKTITQMDQSLEFAFGDIGSVWGVLIVMLGSLDQGLSDLHSTIELSDDTRLSTMVFSMGVRG